MLVISCLVIHEFGIVWFSDVSLDSAGATLKWSQNQDPVEYLMKVVRWEPVE